MEPSDIHVVKLGGSLLDSADLLVRFERFREQELQGSTLLVVGGGDVADCVRAFDARFHLDPETAHWIAIGAMQINARMLAAVVPGCRLTAGAEQCRVAWGNGELAVMDPLVWLEGEHRAGIHIPHRWTFTSDSIAAHVARRLGAGLLTLLKSTSPKSDCGVACAAGLGIVDPDFEMASAGLPAIELINYRSDPPRRFALQAARPRP